MSGVVLRWQGLNMQLFDMLGLYHVKIHVNHTFSYIQVTYFHFIVHTTTIDIWGTRGTGINRPSTSSTRDACTCMHLWQLHLLELSHFQSICCSLPSSCPHIPTKHHKPSNRCSCLSFSVHVIVTKLVEVLYSICVDCALRLDQHKLNMAHQLYLCFQLILCVVLCAGYLSTNVHMCKTWLCTC